MDRLRALRFILTRILALICKLYFRHKFSTLEIMQRIGQLRGDYLLALDGILVGIFLPVSVAFGENICTRDVYDGVFVRTFDQ